MTFHERPELDPPVTKASIMAAWQAAESERRQIERACGVQIDDHGRIVRQVPR